MAWHTLKIQPEPFRAIRDGSKRHEYRRDDRDPPFTVGDFLVLQEWDPDGGGYYSGQWELVRVTRVTNAPDFDIPDGFCVMSVQLQKVKIEDDHPEEVVPF